MIGTTCMVMVAMGTMTIMITTRTFHRLFDLLLTDWALGLTKPENGLADVVLPIGIV